MFYKNKRMYALAAVIVLALSIMVGCNENKRGDVGELGGAEQTNYPIQTNVKLKYWLRNSAPVGSYTDKSQYPWFKEWQKQTGVEMEFIFPSLGQDREQFNTLIASGDMPDIMEYTPSYLNGGPERALKEGYFAKLDDLMGYMPNFNSFLDNNKEYDDLLKASEGYIALPGVVEPGHENKLLAVCGYMVRQDWLDELNMEVPQTIDEIYLMLKAFKERGIEVPLCIPANDLGYGISGAFGAPFNFAPFFQEGGQVKFGRLEPGYKDFLTTIKKWYDEGLIDPNFASLDQQMVDYAMTSGKSGIAFGYIGGQMGTWINSSTVNDPNYNLTAIPYPTLNKGERVKFSTMQNSISLYTSISAKSKYKELAARVLDYGFSEEGHMLFNFGIEGITYDMIDGYPTYSDLLMKNPDGLSVAQAMQINIRANSAAPSIQDHRYIEQYYQIPQQKNATDIWSDVDTREYTLAMINNTPEESREITKLMSDINTYCDEMYLNFILGKESLDNYDKYIEQLKNLGIEKVIQLNQDALDRFNAK